MGRMKRRVAILARRNLLKMQGERSNFVRHGCSDWGAEMGKGSSITAQGREDSPAGCTIGAHRFFLLSPEVSQERGPRP